ncbi:hypothetical protein FHG08_08895 [Pseudoalteromonas sp. Scap03]|uniref:formyltransferase family protein n=1 Tax=unclassified Pseudoalteromonas TaxID=194690 RepID=UPI0015BABE00|nr:MULTISPECIES: formyltransferase family protein [unclassified Pseudoalteromonas]NWL15840.1 hypothetical protein [Pseudoalteromonas sp. Scap03]QLE80982.1 hypothetical protein FLM54_05165 [Pseudoalteromonas sp. Scap25]QLE88925.1 hypothetical protein FLM47_05160 [Pseudoalteromonas sp. Scap06]
MYKYAFFTGSCLSLPAINYLIKSDQLACVILPDAAINPDLQQLQQWLQQQQITILHYNKLDDQPFLAKLDELRVNRGLIYLFRHQIKTPLIQYFNGALANVHPSSLPDYKGPQPLYWQIRNGEPLTRLTIHKVTEELDGGDIGCDVEIDIHPFDTIKCLHQKVAQYLPYLVSQFIQLDQTGELRWQKQRPNSNKLAPTLQHSELVINWHQHSSTDVVNIARAGNADMGCAVFYVGQSAFQLLQATEVECVLHGIQPGTVIELDKQTGLVIKTHDSALKLDIIGAQQGYLDGYRFALLFAIDPGMVLGK